MVPTANFENDLLTSHHPPLLTVSTFFTFHTPTPDHTRFEELFGKKWYLFVNNGIPRALPLSTLCCCFLLQPLFVCFLSCELGVFVCCHVELGVLVCRTVSNLKLISLITLISF